MTNETPVLTVGTVAYFDSFVGLIPCKVLRLTETSATIKITAARTGYKRGEIIETNSRWSVVPRTAIFRRSGHYRIARFTMLPEVI